MAAVLALCSSLVWGIADFCGGILVRRFPVATISVLSHGTGLVAMGIAAVLVGVDERAFLIGIAAGVFGAASLYTFYRAMAVGTMSIVSPLLSLGSVLAFTLAVIGGERPSLVSLAGGLIAVAGAAFVSVGEHVGGGTRRAALAWALAAPVALGFYLYLLARAANEGGSVSAVFGARVISTILLLTLALWLGSPLRIGWRPAGAASTIGFVGVAALALFAQATRLGLISITTILASLYPIVTILLAHLIIGERLRAGQLLGVTLALAGVALVTAG